jgi:hypothetical protein
MSRLRRGGGGAGEAPHGRGHSKVQMTITGENGARKNLSLAWQPTFSVVTDFQPDISLRLPYPSMNGSARRSSGNRASMSSSHPLISWKNPYLIFYHERSIMKHQRDVRPVKGAVMRGDATPFNVDEEEVASSRAMALAGRSGSSTYSIDTLRPDSRWGRSSQSRREFKRTRVLLSRHDDQIGGAGVR